jgi:hypothetical protein
MGSIFLTAINVVLGLYCVIIFIKNIIQFGLPNHPGRFTLYLVTLCVTAFFVMKAMADLSMINPFFYMRWRALPLVAGSLGLLLQVITIVGQFSHIQQKIISRIPLMGALLFFVFFWEYADWFFSVSVLVAVLFLSISVGKARYQKRMLVKMCLFLGLFGLFRLFNVFSLYVVGELFLFPALFYFFIFEQSYGISALVEEHEAHSGVS